MITSMESRLPDYAPWNTDEQSFLSARSTAAGISLSKNTDIVLYTQEGDKVTLSSSAQQEAKYASYEALAGFTGASGAGMAWEKGTSFEMSAGTQFSMTVEGDLNPQEMADIGKALKTIDKIMGDLISEDYDKILQRVQKLGELDSLQSLSADLHFQREIYYEHQETQMISAVSDTAENAGSPGNPPISQPAEAAAVQGIMDTVGAPNSQNKKMLSLLDRYFSELSDKFGHRHADKPEKLDMIDRIKSRLAELGLLETGT